MSIHEFGTLSLAHLSVKEYLISKQIRNSPLSYYHLDKKLANSAISCNCLCNESRASILFGRYAAKFWITHACSDDGVIQNDVQELVVRLLSLSGVHFNNWIMLFDADTGYGSDSLKTSYYVPHPLYYTSLLGLGQIANELVLSSSADANITEGFYGSALGSTLSRGHKEVVQILLENGADVNILGEYSGSALVLASAGGHREVIQILLKKGADVNIAGEYNGSALVSASARGHKEVVQMLLENRANVNIVGGIYSSALVSASARGHKGVIQMLLENRANMNFLGGGNHSPLRLSLTYGYVSIAQILLDHGADVNLKHEDGCSALKRARERSHEAIVQLLLEHGVDPNEIGVDDVIQIDIVQ